MAVNLTAFHPLLVLEKPATEKLKSSIQCLECCGRNLYVASRDCVVQHCVLLERQGGRQGVREARRKQAGSKGTITQMKALPVLNHLLLLCDSTIRVLNMFSLEPMAALPQIRNVCFMGVDDATSDSGPSVELFTLSSRRRAVSVHVVSVHGWECVREVPLCQHPVALAVSGSCLCVATCEKYVLHDHRSGANFDLFPHDSTKHRVIVNTSGKEEFLLNGPGALGMFVTRHGISQRAPLQWSERIWAAVSHPPYVLALQSEGLLIYSMVDQRLKQSLPLHKAKGLVSTPESVLVFTEREVYNLLPVPVEEQIEALVNNRRVDEALQLLLEVKTQYPKDSYELLEKHLNCTAGFVKFYQERFSEAKELLIRGHVDPREVVSLYPELCEGIEAQFSAVFNARDLCAVEAEDSAVFQRYQEFLMGFLRAVRGTDQGHGCAREIDCTLLKLYAQRGRQEELVWLLASHNECSLNTCAPFLEKHKRFFALGLLYQSHGQADDALQSWMNIVDGLWEDTSHADVYKHIVTFVRQQTCRELLWKYADWVLRRNQEVGVEIFFKRKNSEESFCGEEVEFLTKYPKALVLYLEYFVNDLNSKEEKHHTLLAMMYVADVLRGLEIGETIDTTTSISRQRLQQLLQCSTCYSPEEVQKAIAGTFLHEEKAILHGRAGEHEKALRTLIYDAMSCQEAEDYCRRVSQGRSMEFRCQIHLALLTIYLELPRLQSAAIDLVNGNAAAFDPIDVLRVLPSSWSVQLVGRFLSDTVRRTFHTRRMGWLEKSLAQVEHLRHKEAWVRATKGQIKIERGQVCQRCGRYLTKPVFLRSLKGELIHTHCCTMATTS